MTLLAELKALVAKHEGEPAYIPEAREGFSEETTELGGWTHSLLDETLADLKSGDSFSRQVAEQAPRAIVFDPRIKAPEDEDAAKLAQLAYQRHWAMQWIVNQEPVVLDYAIRRPERLTDDLRNDYYEHQDSHGVMLMPPGMDAATGIRKYVKSLRDHASTLRHNSETGLDKRPGPR